MGEHVHDQLIEGCRLGDRSAQFELYEQYKRYIFNLNLRMLASRADAEDVLQEAFLEAFTKISTLNENRGFGNWLKKIAVRRCLDVLRKRKVDFEEIGTRDFAAPATETTTSIDPGLLHNAIQKLPDGCRSVFTLFELEGYDHSEISQIMQVSDSTSKTQLHRARKLLSQFLRKDSLTTANN